MAQFRVGAVFTKGTTASLISSLRLISTTPCMCVNRKWREEKGLPLHANAYGILTDGPDYSYLDGRPTPYGIRQMKRIQKQKEIAEKIIELTAEVDFAVERHKKLVLEEEQRKKQIIENKLKPKGLLLLKKQ